MIDHFSLWREQPIVVLDTETTGYTPTRGDRIVEVAAVRMENLRITQTWHSLINPCRPIPDEASRVHCIYDEDVLLAPRFHEKAESLAEFCRGAVPCAYKEQFDRSFMIAEFWGANVKAEHPLLTWSPWLDALDWVRSVDRFLPNAKGDNSLVNACKRRGIEIANGAHGALADATAAAQLLAAIAHEMPQCTISELIRRQGAINSAWNKRWDGAKAAGRVT